MSHDPFAPADVSVSGDFPSDRWRRAGATPEEIEALTRKYAAQSAPTRDAFVRHVASVSDNDLRAALEDLRQEPDFAAEVDAATAPPEDHEARVQAVRDVLGGRESALTGYSAPQGAPGPETGAEAETGASEERTPEYLAAHGDWEPAEAPLDVDGTSYPLWNLTGGWVGTLIGDEVNGVHLIRATTDELTAATRELVAAQK